MDPVSSSILGESSKQITEKLNAEMETIQGRVSRARDNAEEILPNVSKWLSDVADLVKEVDTFVAADMANLLNCCNGCCPNTGSRCRLGTERGKFDSVGHPTPQTHTYLFTSTTDSQHFVSRAWVFHQIMEALMDDNVYMIGIHGMAGVGKSTMVDQLSKHVKDMKLFDDFAKAVVSQTPDSAKIQRDLAACLNLALPKESEAQDASLLCSRLKIGKKILVIIDGVWDPIKLDKIGIPSQDYIKGCKILLTSRREDVYVQMEVQREFQIGVLWKSEAWSLFRNIVGNTIQGSHEIRSIAKQVCGKCGGLPLAIVTLGAALKSMKLHVWNDTLNQLKSCTADSIHEMEKQVYLPIKLSYDFLQHTDTKACLLYCCLYREDEEICIEDLVWYGVGRWFLSSRETVEAARHRVRTIVDTLKTSCLLLEGSDEDYVRMHDIIRDIALSIAVKDTDMKLLVRSGGVRQWPKYDELQCCRTFSFVCHINEEFPNVLECPELRTLVLRNEWFDCTQEVPQSFFDVTKKLEVLFLHGMGLLASASFISNLVNIRILCLYGCELENLSFLEELKELEMLIICDDNIAALTSEVGNLSRLRVLDLRNCDRLKAISAGIISRLSCLEELYLPDEFDKWESEGNARLDELNLLPCLHILHTCIPATANAKALLLLSHEPQCWSLIKFKISVGCQFHRFNKHSNTSYMRILELVGFDRFNKRSNTSYRRNLKLMRIDRFNKHSNTSYTRILKLEGGEPIVLMKKAEALDLVGLKGLQKAFEDSEGKWFLDLKSLKVKNCKDEMEHGFLLGKPKWSNPEVFQESKLNELRMYNCGFKYLFSRSIARCLLQLQILEVGDCDSMEEIVGDDDIDEQVGNEVLVFPQLKTLKLRSLPNLICFYANTKTKSTAQPLFDQKVSFPALEELNVDNLENIATIWNIQFEAVSSLGLQKLSVSNCDKLVNVIVSFACPKLQDRQGGELDMTILPKLKIIELFGLQNIKSFCGFKSNEEEMEEDKNLQVNALFSPKVSFPALEELDVYGLKNIATIWKIPFEAVSSLGLQQLSVSYCDKLVNVIVSSACPKLQDRQEGELDMTILPKLKIIELFGLQNIKSFCSFKSNEEEMEEDKNLHVNAFFSSKVFTPALEVLNLGSLESITTLWDIQFGQEGPVFFLKFLGVSSCEKLVNVVSSSMFSKLQADDEMVKFPTLESIQLKDLPNLKCFFGSNEEEKLKGKIDEVQVLFNHKVKLPCLEALEVMSIPRLRVIWDVNVSTDSFHSLRLLWIRNCLHLEEIFRSVEVSNEMKEIPADETQNNLLLPQLKHVWFQNLPQLRSIYSRFSTSKVFSSVESVEIKGCPILEKELPMTTSYEDEDEDEDEDEEEYEDEDEDEDEDEEEYEDEDEDEEAESSS